MRRQKTLVMYEVPKELLWQTIMFTSDLKNERGNKREESGGQTEG